MKPMTPQTGRWIRTAVVAGLLFGGAERAVTPQVKKMPYTNRALPIEKRVDDLIRRMTLDEKIGQMTQADHASLKSPSEVDALFLGSVLSGGDSELPDVSARGWLTHTQTLQKRALGTRLGIPLIYGIDAVHGHNNVRGAVVFRATSVWAARAPKIVEEASRITALEVAGTGMHWNFAPCLAVPQDDRWGRACEDSANANLPRRSGAAVRGLRDRTSPVLGAYLPPPSILSAMVGRDTAWIEAIRSATKPRCDDPPARICCGDQGRVGSIMVSFSSWNGEKMHGHRRLITDVLRGELGFQGIVISD
jgi:beta-glucosidase